MFTKIQFIIKLNSYCPKPVCIETERNKVPWGRKEQRGEIKVIQCFLSVEHHVSTYLI